MPNYAPTIDHVASLQELKLPHSVVCVRTPYLRELITFLFGSEICLVAVYLGNMNVGSVTVNSAIL